MRAVDIYQRYNPVNDWLTLASQVDAVYVKGTDGNGPAIVRATGYVEAAQEHEIPVGLYHFAQKIPSARVQANVLTAEVRRLNATGLPPALDIENNTGLTWTAAEARQFTVDFRAQLRGNGFQHVTVYANRSMLDMIRPEDWLDDDTFIWLAEYGANDGMRHPYRYNRTRVDMHQFTSKGRVPGVGGDVDLNEIHNSAIVLDGSTEDMELTEKMRPFIWPHTEEIEDTVGSTLANTQSYAKTVSTSQLPQLQDEVVALSREVRELKELLAQALGSGLTLGATGEIVVKATPTPAG